MLEAEIARDVANKIVEDAKTAGAMRVVSADIIVGGMRQIDEGLLSQEVVAALQGTVAAGLTVNIARTPVTMRCLDCGEVYPVTLGEKNSFTCPACSSERRTVETGMELAIDGMQVVIPNESEGASMADKLAKAVEDRLGPVEK